MTTWKQMLPISAQAGQPKAATCRTTNMSGPARHLLRQQHQRWAMQHQNTKMREKKYFVSSKNRLFQTISFLTYFTRYWMKKSCKVNKCQRLNPDHLNGWEFVKNVYWNVKVLKLPFNQSDSSSHHCSTLTTSDAWLSISPSSNPSPLFQHFVRATTTTTTLMQRTSHPSFYTSFFFSRMLLPISFNHQKVSSGCHTTHAHTKTHTYSLSHNDTHTHTFAHMHAE